MCRSHPPRDYRRVMMRVGPTAPTAACPPTRACTVLEERVLGQPLQQPLASCWANQKWSERGDSNSRPLAPEASALPGCATLRQFLKFARRARLQEVCATPPARLIEPRASRHREWRLSFGKAELIATAIAACKRIWRLRPANTGLTAHRVTPVRECSSAHLPSAQLPFVAPLRRHDVDNERRAHAVDRPLAKPVPSVLARNEDQPGVGRIGR